MKKGKTLLTLDPPNSSTIATHLAWKSIVQCMPDGLFCKVDAKTLNILLVNFLLR